MANYVSRGSGARKSEALAKRKKELLGTIAANAPQAKLEKTAERFRAAKLSLLKAQEAEAHENLRRDVNPARLANITAERERWLAMTVLEVR